MEGKPILVLMMIFGALGCATAIFGVIQEYNCGYIDLSLTILLIITISAPGGIMFAYILYQLHRLTKGRK